MANNGAVTITPGKAAQTIAAGYHNGSGSVAGDTDLVAGNIKSGVNIFGVAGSVLQSTGTATAANVLSGSTFSNGTASGLTGSMANNGAVTVTPGKAAQTIVAGYHNGSGSVAGDTDLIASNIKSGAAIFGVSGSLIQATGNAAAWCVLTGNSFSNSGAAGISGTMPYRGEANFTPGASAVPVQEGYYGGGQVNTDYNLVSGNIKSGVTIFGVNGKPNVVDTTEAANPAAAGNIMSGKKAYVNGALVTGTLTNGFTCTTGDLSPLGRWCDNHNGTVRDMTSGLIWLKDAGWGGLYPIWAASYSTANANDKACLVHNGNPVTLTDGSSQGYWRLPTKLELVMLTVGPEYISSSAMYKFTSVQGGRYWSSSSDYTYTALGIDMVDGETFAVTKDDFYNYYVWPVRSGQ
jgi:hypothetical protein